jgi:hypothetical protein
MKNIQIIDGADNCTFSLFQATDDEFAVIFPAPGQDMEVIEDVIERVDAVLSDEIFERIWKRPILKRDALGIHGTLYYHWGDRRQYLPESKREVDWDDSYVNASQRALFAEKR